MIVNGHFLDQDHWYRDAKAGQPYFRELHSLD